jgi:acyl-CoA synthetase (AMP-forming)/AMP-acid ligase II
MRITDEKTARETTACLFPTSGTTGLPKLCQLSHHAEIAKSLSMLSEGKDYEVKTLVSVPLFHIFGAALVHVNVIRRGDPVYVMSRFDLKKYATAIQKYGITDTAVTPQMVVYLLKSGLPLKDMLSSLRYIWCDSAPIDAAVLDRFYGVLSPKAIITGLWGMSETRAQTFFKWPERDTTGSVGRLTPGTEIRYVFSLV